MQLNLTLLKANKLGISLAVMGALILAGCGGGGGGATTPANNNGGTLSGKVTLSGTVASGAPLGSSSVSIRDKNGKTASATTLADGTYSAEVTTMTAPYLIKVGNLYSVATATTTSTANVHPFTDMIVRNWYKVQGSNADTAFAATGAMPTPPTATDIDTIEAVVSQILATYMRGANVNPASFNLITTPFNANHAGFDLVLDNLKVTQPTTPGGNVTIGLAGGGSTSTILTVADSTDLTTITPPPAPVSDTVAPSVPGLITATRTSATQVVLSWIAATDNIQVAGYKIYRNAIQVGITDQPYYIDGAAPATNACYTVSAYDAAGNSSVENTQVCASATAVAADTTPPTAPTLTATASSSSQIDLAWTASTDAGGMAGYRVMVGGAAIATLPATATSYSHTGLNGSTAYSYTVVAIDTSGNATSSAAASATTGAKTDTTAPTAPSGLAATVISSSQIDLTWTASTDAVGVTGYKVYSGSTLAGTSATASFSAVNLTASTQYCYTVNAYDAAGNVSAASAETCATTSAASSLALLMSGSWWEHNNDDGLRQDGTVDLFGLETNGPSTITVTNGAWTLTGPDITTSPAPHIYNLTFPATAVTESGNTVTLMDADGLGRTLLTYDTASKSIKGQWQKLAPDGVTWWANYETWTETNLIADTWQAYGDGTTYTFKADGSYTGWVPGPNGDGSGGFGYEQGTYTWNSSTGSFTGFDATHNTTTTNPGTVVAVSGNTMSFNGMPAFTRATKPSTIVGSWTLPVQPDGTGGTNLVLTFFANGDYMQSQSVVPPVQVTGWPGLEHGTYTWNSGTGAFSIGGCPPIDTNGDAGFTTGNGCGATSGTILVSGNTLTLGTYTFTRIIDTVNPIVGSWFESGDTNLVFTFFANGDYMLSQSFTSEPAQQPGLEHGTYTWNASTGAFTVTCPTVDTNLLAGFSAPNGVQCTAGTIFSNITATVSGNTMPYVSSGWATVLKRVVTPNVPAPQTFTEYPLPAGSLPLGIASGPDGNLWFTDAGTNSIGKMTPAGVVTLYAIPSTTTLPSKSGPNTIVYGPDGNLWFVEGNSNNVAKITTAGVITEYANTAGGWPQDLAVGPDGNIWFTDQGVAGGGATAVNANGAIGMLNIATGAITKYPLLTANTLANWITRGPDGAMWFTQSGGSSNTSRITTAGVITEYANTAANGITTGSDGNLWVTTPTGGVARLTTAGVMTPFNIPTTTNSAFFIVAAPDGNLWTGESGGSFATNTFTGVGMLGRVTTSGVITEYPLPASSNSNPGYFTIGAMTVGADGALWFAETQSNKIGRYAP